MYRHNAATEDKIQEFLVRYKDIDGKIQFAKAQEEKFAEKYRRLRKMEYNIQLAQNRQYCYGAQYLDPEEMRRREEEDLRRMEEAERNDRVPSDKTMQQNGALDQLIGSAEAKRIRNEGYKNGSKHKNRRDSN